MRKLVSLVVATMALTAVAASAAFAATSITYTGQGFNGTVLGTSKCDAGDNGGTGQAIPADGRYLLWVLNGSVTGTPVLHLPDGSNPSMIKVGAVWKYVSPYFTKAQLLGPPAVTATFSGGSPNNLVVSHGCARVPSHVSTTIHAGSNDANGVSSPSGNLGSKVHDSAQVTVDNSVAIPAGSTVTFKWYKGSTLVETSAAMPVGANGSVDPALPEGPLHAGDYHYTASFTSGNTNLVGSSVAGDETLHINQGQLEINTQIHGVNGAHSNVGGDTHVALGSTAHDTATITGQVDGIDAPGAGDVSFTLDGADAAKDASTDPDAIRTAESAPLAAGSHTYKAHVNGNSDYLGDDSADEPLTVDKAQLTVTTVLHGVNGAHNDVTSTHQPLGSTVHDTATISGQVAGFDAPTAADVSFTRDGDAIAKGSDESADTAASVESDPLHAGHYVYNATVDGNANYVGDTSDDEPLDVDQVQLHITTTIHNDSHAAVTSVTQGAIVHDTASVTGQVPGFDTGAISFTLDGNPVANGNGEAGATANSTSVDTTTLTVGNHTFKAVVAGNGDYVGDTSADEPLSVTSKDKAAWCSPGFWRNASDAAWAQTGHSRTDLFNQTVVPTFYSTAFISATFPNGPTLNDVLTESGANTFGAVSGPFVPGLNAFNAVGAMLTDALDGYTFTNGPRDPRTGNLIDNCPVSNGGVLTP